MTETQIHAALDEYQALAATLFGEARNQPIEGIVAVGWVVKHRLARFAKFRADEKTYKSVVLAPKQFSCWNAGTDANHLKLIAVAERMVQGESPVDEAWLECAWVAVGIIENRLRDSVMGSTYYLTADLYRTAPPVWATRLDVIQQYGDHVFLRDPPSKVLIA